MGTGKLENIVPTKYKKDYKSLKYNSCHIFKQYSGMTFLPDVVVLFLCLPLAPLALHLLHVKKKSS